ncbi:hypothetical protein [uncultured Pseudacidovorax sp.]|uniref:hypothetical protein n=1 Tax=uncultured Pseudacidovorax sp. TaxID=679313 RepID=UPI0026002528|nr:hypothetical protein [uncultured Pseudacidovorax sp.]
MKKTRPSLLAAAVLLAGAASPFAAAAYDVGQALSPAELSALAAATRYDVAGTVLTPLPGGTAVDADGRPTTMVANATGAVGLSRNEVRIAQWPTDSVRARAGTLLAGATWVQYTDHTQTTRVRYASFAEAVKAYRQLQAALPQASVALPVEFNQRRSR